MTQSIQRAETLLALAERCEAAGEGDQGRLIEHAWEALAECSPSFRRFATAYLPGFDNHAGRFAMCLEARAYESAAMMLVPEGVRLQLGEWDDEVHLRPRGAWQAILTKPGAGSSFAEMNGVGRCEHAQTAALALTAACLRALASQEKSASHQILQEGSPA